MPLSPPWPRPPQVLPLAPNRMAQRETAAQTTDRWIDLLARQQGLHRLAYLQMIRSRGLLAREVGKLIAESALAEGDRAFDADEPPPDGGDLSDRIARTQWRRREAAARAEWERDTTPNEDEARATAAGFAALRAMHGATKEQGS